MGYPCDTKLAIGEVLAACPAPSYPPAECFFYTAKMADTCIAIAVAVKSSNITEGGFPPVGLPCSSLSLQPGDELLVCNGKKPPAPTPAPPPPPTPAPKPTPPPAPTPAPPTPGPVCTSTEYCCPDAKKCLTPTATSCAKDATVCAAGQVCCPLTKICVTPGADCVSPCAGSYCCPEVKKCLTPASPDTIVSGPGACSAGSVFCPLTKLCVYAGPSACVPP